MTPHEPVVFFRLTDRRRFAAGLALVLLGLVLPGVFTVYDFGVYHSLTLALHYQDGAQLLATALSLALFNAIRCFPHYIGAFWMGEALTVSSHGQIRRWPSAVLVAGVIVAVYRLVEAIHHVHYDFGAPALSLVTIQLVLWKANYSYISLFKKTCMQMSFITAFQFLDVTPALNALPFGRGETSQIVKQAAEVLELGELLNTMCLIFFWMFLLMGLMLFFTLRDENRLREIAALKEQSERIKSAAIIQEQENRVYQEMQHLVHDLKSPLTSIQNLVGVMQFSCTGPDQAKEREYLERIEASVESMSQMISEILYEDSRSLLPTTALITMVSAQVSILSYAPLLSVVNQVPDALLHINRIRFARAIVNLLNNASNALPPEGGEIWLTVYRSQLQNTPVICIEVRDNGCGIAPEQLSKVWDRGWSGRGSHGLGLAYVKTVVEASDGTVSLESKVGRGTTVTILLPEGGICDDEN